MRQGIGRVQSKGTEKWARAGGMQIVEPGRGGCFGSPLEGFSLLPSYVRGETSRERRLREQREPGSRGSRKERSGPRPLVTLGRIKCGEVNKGA